MARTPRATSESTALAHPSSTEKQSQQPSYLSIQDARYPRPRVQRALRWLMWYSWLVLLAYPLCVLIIVLVRGVLEGWSGLGSAAANRVLATYQLVLAVPAHPAFVAIPAGLVCALVWLHLWAVKDYGREEIVLHVRSEWKQYAVQRSQPRILGEVSLTRDTADDPLRDERITAVAKTWREGAPDDRGDPLHYGQFVEKLARLIVASAHGTPFAVSIEAEWGMGKSTAMAMLRAQLTKQKFYTGSFVDSRVTEWQCVTIWFNAWKYRGADIQKAFLSTIFDQIPRRAYRHYLGSLVRRQLLRLGLDEAGRAMRMGDLGAAMSEQLNTTARYRNSFEQDFKAILASWRKMIHSRPLMVIFVDDLDRCTPTDIARVLELMKLFFDTPGCVFVLGFDPKIVANSIQRDYKGLIGDGLTYLKKLVQLNFPLPQPDDDALKTLIHQGIVAAGLLLFFKKLDEQHAREISPAQANGAEVPDGDAVSTESAGDHAWLEYGIGLILRGTGGNPREIKRFLNALTVSSQLTEERYSMALCLLLLLQIRWPRCYLDVIRVARQGRGANNSTDHNDALDRLIRDIDRAIHLAREEEDTPTDATSPELQRLQKRWLWLGDADLCAFLADYPLHHYLDDIVRLVSRFGVPVIPDAALSAGPGVPSQAGIQSVTKEAVQEAVQEAVAEYLEANTPIDVVPPEPQGPPFDVALLLEPEQLVGRQRDLDWLEIRLRDTGKGSVTALSGMGGIGKTALAAVVARKLWKEGLFADGIAVVLCQNLADETEVLRRILARFDPLRRRPTAKDITGLVEAAYRLLYGKSALIVLDNIEPDLLVEPVVAPLRAAGATVLLLARHILSHPAVSPDASRQLELLDHEDAVALFLHSWGRGRLEDVSDTERAAVQRIVSQLARHTLAVRLAGAYAADTRRDVSELADELEDAKRMLALPLDERQRGIALAFARSTDMLPPAAQRLFAALAIFAGADFSRSAASSLALALEAGDPKTAVDLLVRRALVEATVNTDMPMGSDRERLRLHPLLRAFAAERFAALSPILRETAQKGVAHYYASYVANLPNGALGPDEANIEAALEWAQVQNDVAVLATLCAGMRFLWRDRWQTDDALTYLPRGIAAAEQIAEATGERTMRLRAADIALTYGQVLLNIGRLDDAEQALTANLALRQAMLDREGLGKVLTSLGDLAQVRGQVALAQDYYQQALALRRQVNDRRGVGVVLMAQGQLAQARGQMDAAETTYQEALGIAREVGNRRGEGEALYSLGQIARYRGQLVMSEQLFQESLSIFVEVQDRQAEGILLSRLAQIQRARGRLDEAAANLETSLARMREVRDRRGEGAVLVRLGQLAYDRGHLDEAERRYTDSLEIHREVQDRQGEGLVLSRLGRLQQGRGQLAQAEASFLRSLTIHREVQDRRGEGTDLGYLGQIARTRGELDRAVSYLMESLAIRRDVQDRLGEAFVLYQLGQVARYRQELDHAQEYFEQSLAIDREVQDRRSEGTALSMLGRVAHARHNLDEAEHYFQDALHIAREIDNRQGEGVDLYELGRIAEERGKLETAEQLYRDSLDIATEVQSGIAIADSQLALGSFLLRRYHKREEGCQLLRNAIDGYAQMGLPQEQDARVVAEQLGCDI